VWHQLSERFVYIWTLLMGWFLLASLYQEIFERSAKHHLLYFLVALTMQIENLVLIKSVIFCRRVKQRVKYVGVYANSWFISLSNGHSTWLPSIQSHANGCTFGLILSCRSRYTRA
jgi:hypothetical protein